MDIERGESRRTFLANLANYSFTSIVPPVAALGIVGSRAFEERVSAEIVGVPGEIKATQATQPVLELARTLNLARHSLDKVLGATLLETGSQSGLATEGAEALHSKLKNMAELMDNLVLDKATNLSSPAKLEVLESKSLSGFDRVVYGVSAVIAAGLVSIFTHPYYRDKPVTRAGFFRYGGLAVAAGISQFFRSKAGNQAEENARELNNRIESIGDLANATPQAVFKKFFGSSPNEMRTELSRFQSKMSNVNNSDTPEISLVLLKGYLNDFSTVLANFENSPELYVELTSLMRASLIKARLSSDDTFYEKAELGKEGEPIWTNDMGVLHSKGALSTIIECASILLAVNTSGQLAADSENEAALDEIARNEPERLTRGELRMGF